MDEAFQNFIIWEKASRDTIDFKRCYCYIAGDLIAGLLLSQIIFWFLPNQKGELKVKILKDGRYWLCRGRTDWFDECFITPDQFDRASKILVNKGFIQKKRYKFNNTPRVHISLNTNVIREALINYYNERKEELRESLGLASLLTSGACESLPKKDFMDSLKGLRKELYENACKWLKDKPTLKNKQEYNRFVFEYFWDIYGYKRSKERSFKKFKLLTLKEMKKAIEMVPEYKKAAGDYINGAWNYLGEKIFNDDMSYYQTKNKNTGDRMPVEHSNYFDQFK